MLSKFAFIIIMLCHQWLNTCKNVRETIEWITKFELWEKNGLNFKLKQRRAQKSILSMRFRDLYKRARDQCCIRESWHISTTISISKFKGFPDLRLCYKIHSKRFSMYYWFMNYALERIAKQSRTWADWGIGLLMSLKCTKGMWNMLVLLTFIRDF